MIPQEDRLPRKARVLVLHGAAQSGQHMKVKTRFIETSIEKAFQEVPAPGFKHSYPDGFEFLYPTAPHRLVPANMTGCPGGIYEEMSEEDQTENDIITNNDYNPEDLEAWVWAFGDRATAASEEVQGLEESLKYVLGILRAEGPFIGIIGFSSGATLALILLSLAERGASPELTKFFRLDKTILPPQPFRFGLLYSGSLIKHARYRSFFYPKIETPVLHFVGKLDTWISESEMLEFSERFQNVRTVHHSGGHFVARYRHCQEAMLEFVVERMKQWGGCRVGGPTGKAVARFPRRSCRVCGGRDFAQVWNIRLSPRCSTT